MIISEESLTAFIDAYESDFAEKLDRDNAIEAAARLVAFLKLTSRLRPYAEPVAGQHPIAPAGGDSELPRSELL